MKKLTAPYSSTTREAGTCAVQPGGLTAAPDDPAETRRTGRPGRLPGSKRSGRLLGRIAGGMVTPALFIVLAFVAVFIGFSPAPAAADPFAYVANSNSNTVSVIDTATNTVVATVPVFETPFEVAFTPNGAFAYVSTINGNNVSVIDTNPGSPTFNTVVATVPVGGLGTGLAITPDGAFAYLVREDFAAVTTVAVIDTDPLSPTYNTVVATVPVGGRQFSVAVTPNGAFAYVTNRDLNDVSVIDTNPLNLTTFNTVVATVPVGSFPIAVAVTPNGAFAYVANRSSNTVSVIATATNSVVATVPVGIIPQGVAFTPDGAFAYVTNFDSNNVSVIDTATNTVVATVTVGENPAGVAIRPNPGATPIGLDVTVSPPPVDENDPPIATPLPTVRLTFDEVTTAGETTLTITAPGDPPEQTGLKLGNPAVYLNLATTATFAGAVEVCVDYTNIGFGAEGLIGLYHHDGTGWVDVTSPAGPGGIGPNPDVDNNIVCGTVTSLSPFALVEPKDPSVLIDELALRVAEINAKRGILNSLDAKLETAESALSDANEINDVAAANALRAFINHVEAQRDKKITIADANDLKVAAEEIIFVLENF